MLKIICPHLTSALSDAIDELDPDIAEETKEETTFELRYPEIHSELNKWGIPILPGDEAKRVAEMFGSNMPMVCKIWNELRKGRPKDVPECAKKYMVQYLHERGYETLKICGSLKVPRLQVIRMCEEVATNGT